MSDLISKSYIGIDISKTNLDVCFDDKGTHAIFPNTPNGCKELIEQLKKYENVHVVMEATGGYEKRSHKLLSEANVVVSIVNANQVRHFAKSKSVLEKSDKIDARIIRLFGKQNEPSPTALPDVLTQELSELSQRRDQLVKMRAIELQHAEKSDNKKISKNIKKMLKILDKQIVEYDSMIDVILQHNQFREIAKIIDSFKGCGPHAIHVLLSDLPELGRIDSKPLSKLVGLAPIICESGTFKGKRRIRGGRSRVRRALYLCALSAAQHNPQIRAMHQRLKEKGKSPKVALAACAHKILHILNAMVKNDKMWDPQRVAVCS